MPSIRYQDKEIFYQIDKKRIKNLYIQIREGKVIVKAPIRMQENVIQEIIEKKSKWIFQNIKREQQEKKEEKPITLREIQRLENVIETAISKYAKQLQVKPNKIRIKNIKYAWGSCSSKKNITINLKLANKSNEAIEYVVLHELCHLKEMNHSKRFWDLVESCMKDYKIYQKELKA